MLDFVKNISPTEIGVIVLILVLLFGSKLITNLARSAGQTMKEIRKIGKSFTEALEDDNAPNSQKSP
jgi:TatA/E family protein of Tat protein translocase